MLGLLAFDDEGGPLMEGYVGRQFVGMGLHRRRSVLVRTTTEGEVRRFRIGPAGRRRWNGFGS
jgi:hypothetical protein